MPMIPLSVVIAAVMGYYLLNELTRPDPRNHFACAFLLLLTIQLSMAGLRFGYGIEEVKIIYPLTASLIGPLAFLSFQNPTTVGTTKSWSLAMHLIPFLVIGYLTITASNIIDPMLGLITLGYGIALIVLGLTEKDIFPWVDFNRREYIYRALWCVAVLAIVSAMTDFVITYDNWHSSGINIPSIVGWTSILVVVLFVAFIIWLKTGAIQLETASQKPVASADIEGEKALLEKLEHLIESTQLHLDPDLNLNRIARKLGIPARQVSVAINRQKSLSVSQFINNLRIQEAFRLLKESDMSVTSIMLQSGYITKSNFNREFNRRTGLSPSVWRKNNK